MRYIYYVVAALIFLAVVNLASRMIGNDTEALLTDLNPDQQVTEAEGQPALEAATPPVVSLEDNEADATETAAETVAEAAPETVAETAVETTSPAAQAAAPATDQVGEQVANPVSKHGQAPEKMLATNSELVEGNAEGYNQGVQDPAPSNQAAAAKATNLAHQAEQEVTQAVAIEKESVIAVDTAVEAGKTEVAKAKADIKTALTSAPVTGVDEASEKVAEKVAESADAALATTGVTATTTPPTPRTEVSNPSGQTLEGSQSASQSTSQATGAVAAAVATTVAAKLAKADNNTEIATSTKLAATTPTNANAEPTAETTLESKPETSLAIAQPQASENSVANTEDSKPRTEPAATTDASKPSLIQSLGDSAGSAATAVVGGAQQAVETVVEAARSLIETDDKPSAVADAASADTEQPSTLASATAIEPATAKAANTTASTEPLVAATEQPAPTALEAQQVQAAAPTAEKEPAEATASTQQQAQATSAAQPAAATNPASADFSTAPAEVLALVNRHPGKTLMIGFFSPNCRDCKPSLSWLNEMRRKYWAQGLQVIGVNLGTEAQAENYLQDAPVSFEILHDPERKLASAFWLAQQPSTYLVNGSGQLLSRHQGHSPSRIGEYEDAIRAALEAQ